MHWEVLVFQKNIIFLPQWPTRACPPTIVLSLASGSSRTLAYRTPYKRSLSRGPGLTSVIWSEKVSADVLRLLELCIVNVIISQCAPDTLVVTFPERAVFYLITHPPSEGVKSCFGRVEILSSLGNCACYLSQSPRKLAFGRVPLKVEAEHWSGCTMKGVLERWDLTALYSTHTLKIFMGSGPCFIINTAFLVTGSPC